MFSLPPLAISSSIIYMYMYYQPLNMESVLFTPLTHVPGNSKCGRPHKGHPLLYGTNCILALARECADVSREILACVVEGPVMLLLPGPSALGQHTVVGIAGKVPAEQHHKPLDRMTEEKTASIMTTMTTTTRINRVFPSSAVH